MKNIYQSGMLQVMLCSLILLSNVNLFAQQAVTSIATAYVAPGSGSTYAAKGAAGAAFSANDFNYNFGTSATGGGSGDLYLNSFTTASDNYVLYSIPGMYVKIRRNNVTLGANAVRFLKYDEGTAVTGTPGAVNIGGSYVDDMELFFLGNSGMNSGSDNLFANTGDGNGNINNIERVDFIFDQGIYTDNNSGAGVSVFERGVAGAHDPVKVALILSMGGAANTPTRFSDVKTIATTDYGATNPLANKNYVIARRDVGTDTKLLYSTTTSQGVGGVYLPFGSFTVDGAALPNGTRINGYVILPNDFSGNRTQIQDYLNPTFFPTNTDASSAGGGIDLTSITGIFRNSAAAVNITLALDLKQFSGSYMNQQTTLQWVSENEKNVLQFELQRSEDGNAFRSIQTLPAKNGANNQYKLIDDVATVASKKLFYRLKMIDKDGTTRYSQIIVMEIKNEKLTSLVCHPSVLQNDFTVAQFESARAENVSIQIVSMNGQVIQQMSKFVNAGRNSILLDHLSALKNGLYQVRIVLADQVLSTKMMKQ